MSSSKEYFPETDGLAKLKAYSYSPTMTIFSAITRENAIKYFEDILHDFLVTLDDLCFRENEFGELSKDEKEKQFDLMMKVRAVLWGIHMAKGYEFKKTSSSSSEGTPAQTKPPQSEP